MSASPRPVRILLVDEEETLTHVVRLALELEGWEVSVAASGADALAFDGDPDIVLLDMSLPDVAGTDVATALRDAGSTATILFLTGRTEHEHRLAAYRAGADDYLTKPFGLDELVERLHRVVRRLGLSTSSRRVEDLVLDLEAGFAWRGGEMLELTSLEFEVLRDLVERRGTRVNASELVAATTARGIRVPREFLARMLARIVDAVNAVGRPLVHVNDAGWKIA